MEIMNKKGLMWKETVAIILVALLIVGYFIVFNKTLGLVADKDSMATEQAFNRLVLAMRYLKEGEKTTEVIPLQKDYMIVMYNNKEPAIPALQKDGEFFNLKDNFLGLNCNPPGCVCLVQKEDDYRYKGIRCEKVNKPFKDSYVHLAYPSKLELQTLYLEMESGKLSVSAKTEENEMKVSFLAGFDEIEPEFNKLGTETIELEPQEFFSNAKLLIKNDNKITFIEPTVGISKDISLDRDYTFFLLITPTNEVSKIYCQNNYDSSDSSIEDVDYCIQAFVDLEECEPLLLDINNLITIDIEEDYCRSKKNSLIPAMGINNFLLNYLYFRKVESGKNEILIVIGASAKMNIGNINKFFDEVKMESVILGSNKGLGDSFGKYATHEVFKEGLFVQEKEG
jgi:tetrahydromethanopterin S-methyltransferase subunit F